MRYTTEKFIEKAKTVHGDKFDYSKTEYKGYGVRTTFVCRKHGEFKQSPHDHIFGKVCCPACVKEINDAQKKPKKVVEKKDPTEEFIRKARETWGDKYDYSKTVYEGSLKNVTIICPVHGEVEVLPARHLNKEKFSGCPKCNYEENLRVQKSRKKPKKRKETKEEKSERLKNAFIEKARQLYGDTYDYSKVEYKNNKVPVTVICRTHGEFPVRPNDHISHGDVCPMCGRNGRRNKRYTQEEFIALANEVFGGYYDYTGISK